MRVFRVLILCLLPTLVAAQPLQIVHRFEVPPFAPVGGLVEAPDGFLYGTTSRGEGGGAIYRVPLAGFPLTVVARFSRGFYPDTTPIVGQGGVLYGTTARGGDSSVGTVYRFDPATSTLSTLHTFDAFGIFPTGRLLQASDGLLYGTTLLVDGGKIFSLDPATGNIRFRHSFAADDPLGSRPMGGFTEGPDGGLYAVTDPMGLFGTIIRFDRATGVVTRAYTFSLDVGRDPVGGLTRTADGLFYGVAKAGGSNDAGTIFRFDPASGSVTAVHHFSMTGPRNPVSRLVEAADGSLYGTTVGDGSGTVFRLRRLAGGGHAFSVVRTLTATLEGSKPLADLVLASTGFVYGATAADTAAGGGGLFRFDSLERGGAGDPTQFTQVAGFESRGRGWRPLAPPTRFPDGALYGLTSAGGTGGFGEVYKFDAVSGAHTMVNVVPSWSIGPYDQPFASGLVAGGDGSFYATIGTPFGPEGRILRVTPALNGVTADTAAIVPLPQGAAGFQSGLSVGPGGIFGLRVTADGLVLFRYTPATAALTTVATLPSGPVLSAPLTAAADGMVYVSLWTQTYIGRSPTSLLQLLQVDPSTGGVTTLVSGLSLPSGIAPVMGPDGSVYFGESGLLRAINPVTRIVRTVCASPVYANVTAASITPDLGRLFVIAAGYPRTLLYTCPVAGGAPTPIHAFDPADGAVSTLAAVDNIFYGVTDGGRSLDLSLSTDAARGGTLFRIAATGATPPFDPDADGLTSVFESAFGLSQASASGDDGPSGDPDHDGLTNLQEQEAGTHPRGVQTRYLAEGASNAFFRTSIALGNTSQSPATVLLRFQTDTGAIVSHVVSVPPTSRGTVDASQVIGLENTSFSTVIESDVPITVDRTMTWDASGYGSHAETATTAPASTWFFAEGSTSGDFALFYLLQNPQTTAVTATVRYLRPLGLPPIQKTYTLPAHSRTTIVVDAEGPDLASTDVSAAITATAPIIAERAMYRSSPSQPFAAGHASAGVTAPALQWFLAEGATGAFFDLFVLIANPNATPAAITADYLLTGGGTLSKSYTVPANGRLTIWVDDEELPAGSGQKPLAAAALSTTIRSTNGQPIVVERTMWWPGPAITTNFWYEAHNAPGATSAGLRWGIAGGSVGYPDLADTYVLIANPNDMAGQARVRVYFQNGNTTTRVFDLPPKSRTTVDIATAFPESTSGGPLSVLVESTGPLIVPIVVESATYTSPGGVQWAAGTNALAALLDPVPPPPP